MSSRNNHKTIIIILATLVFAISSLFLLRNINDPDFFWHAKTGEWIWEHRSLPAEDPFAYTSPGHHTTREHFILTSFWLSQVTYHLFYLAGGTAGIVILRYLIVGALIFILWKRKHGDNIVYLGLIMIFLTFSLDQYGVERPQVFSFLFFAVLLYLLETIKDGAEGKDHSGPGGDGDTRSRSIYFLLPALMLIWANMHPGFIIGHVTMLLYVVIEGLKFLHPSFRQIKIKAYKRLCLAAGAGIIFSFINPNSFYVWKEYLEYKTTVDHWNLDAAYLSTLNPDYMSSVQYFALYNNYTEVLYWLILVLAIAALAFNRKKTDLTDLALLTAAGFASFFTIRHCFFFMIAALPVIARHFSRDRLLKFSRVALTAIALSAGIFFSWSERLNLENLRTGVMIDDYNSPVKAADFIISNDLRGNMYNIYEWGGYLLWQLAPERQVFIDPRDIFGDVGLEAADISNANMEKISGMPIWKDIIRRRSIEYIVIPIAWRNGALIPLFSALMHDEEWLPVFCDINAAIFVKNSPVNEHVISKYSIPKYYLMSALIDLYSRLTDTNPYEATLYVTKGDLYFRQGNVGMAVAAYENAISIAPFNITARARLNLLKEKGLH